MPICGDKHKFAVVDESTYVECLNSVVRQKSRLCITNYGGKQRRRSSHFKDIFRNPDSRSQRLASMFILTMDQASAINGSVSFGKTRSMLDIAIFLLS